jgi:calcineurin-like phosphoesterase family protein
MADKWFVSDTHLFHENILTFKDKDGKLIRPFSSVEEMNETIAQNWNRLIKPQDKVYHLGDVTFGLHKYRREFNSMMHMLNGHKRLTPGNHDKYKDPDLFTHFEKVEYWAGFKELNFTATHFPLRLDSLRDGKFCVHGHTHQNCLDDKHYINVCLEVRNFTPVHVDTILEEIKKAS